MKLQVFSLFLVAFLAAGPVARAENDLGNLKFDPVSPIIKKLIEKIVSKIPEVINVPLIEINLPVPEVAEGLFRIKDLVATGVNKWDTAVKTKLVSKKLDLSITLTEINVNNNYKSDMLFFNLLPIYGEGMNNINIKNLKFQLASSFSLSNGLTISNTSFSVTVEKTTFDVHNFLENEAFSVICGQILSDVVGKFLNDHEKFITRVTSPIIEKLVNTILHPKKNDTPTKITKNYDGLTSTLTIESPMKLNVDDVKKPTEQEISAQFENSAFDELPIDLDELLVSLNENLDSLEDLTPEEQNIVKFIKANINKNTV